MSIEEEVERTFNSGFNCAESVLVTVANKLGAEAAGANAFIPRIATGFGGGIARNGDTCGALSGAVMAISLPLGRDSPEQNRDPCYPAVDRLYNDFMKTFGSCKCRELTGVDFKTPEGNAAYLEKSHRERCTPIVRWATKTALRIIKETPVSDATRHIPE